jgi:hypothetical protein
MDNIYMIESRHYSEDRDRRVQTDVTVDTEHGYFTSQEDADAKALELNHTAEVAYQKYANKRKALQEGLELQYVEKMKAHEFLLSNGFESQAPDKPGNIYVMNYEQWSVDNELTVYEAVEVAQNPVNKQNDINKAVIHVANFVDQVGGTDETDMQERAFHAEQGRDV